MMAGHRLKRWLYLTHRWLGIVSCLFFVLWFASGLVMLYVPFPSLTAGERLAGLAPIDWAQVRLGPRAAMDALPISLPPREMVLEMRGDAPVWRIARWENEPLTVSALDGRQPGPAGEAEARAIARSFGKAPVAALRRIHSDQWTVSGGYDGDRPLWKAELAGPGGRILYVSSVSGAVVLDTRARERFWNWLGSVPHWLYPRALRAEQPLWRQVVIWVSGPCVVVAVTGLWIGLLRARFGKRRFKGGRMTPYHGWMNWHHVSGLVGSLFLILWIFSGWLSVDPGRLFASGGIGAEAMAAYGGRGSVATIDPARLAAVARGAHRVTLAGAAGQGVLRVARPGASDRLLDARTLAPLRPDPAAIRAAAARLVPGAKIAAVDHLTAPDAYWYGVNAPPPLPVLRVRFDDSAATWVHIDPATGAVHGDMDARRRVYRWLFDLFHRWDWGPFLAHPPARELLIWFMSLAGLISSVSAVYVGWKRLVHVRAHGKRRVAAAGRATARRGDGALGPR
jgi:uncharacterized iron-regulated membrane protein